jgi:hypothetical protein
VKFIKLPPKDHKPRGYHLTVETMEGDADDYHEIEFDFCDNEEGLKELSKYVIACEVLKKSYPHGRGGDDNYVGKYFEIFSSDGDTVWPTDCNSDCQDTFEDYEIIYNDGEGRECEVDIELDDVEKKEVEENTAEKPERQARHRR